MEAVDDVGWSQLIEADVGQRSGLPTLYYDDRNVSSKNVRILTADFRCLVPFCTHWFLSVAVERSSLLPFSYITLRSVPHPSKNERMDLTIAS